MNSPDEHWWSVRAGEYVLGTLRGEDLHLFEKILAHDKSAQKEVARWEQAFVVLNETTPQKAPGMHVWPSIQARIGQQNQACEPASDDEIDQKTQSDTLATVHVLPTNLETRSSAWQSIAGLATAASLILGVILLERTHRSEPSLIVDGLAVVLSDEGRVPYYLVETDYKNGQVRVTALSPPTLEETQDFQLWQALPDRSSVRPVALLPEEKGATITLDVDSLIVGSDLFGVSIEPVGAPTNAGPTGPVVAHGDFLSTRAVN